MGTPQGLLNERRVSATPRRIGEDAPPWHASPPSPAGANGRTLPPAHGSRPASVRRSAACDSGRVVCGRWRRLPPKGAGPALTDSIHYRGCCRGAGCLRPGRRGSSGRRRQALTRALRNPATVATAVWGCATAISAVHGFTGPASPVRGGSIATPAAPHLGRGRRSLTAIHGTPVNCCQARCAGIRIRPLRRCPPRADPAS